MTRRLAPYVVGVGGAAAVTAGIGVVEALAPVSGLWALYLLLVLWLGVRWGRGPALAGSIVAFLLYDFYFVPPAGTFAVRGPAELLELFVLLAVAIVTSQLASSLRRARATSEAIASDSRALYELATSMLRTQDVGAALTMVCDSALHLSGVDRFAVVAIAAGKATWLAGSALSDDELKQALWSFDNSKPV